MHGKLMVGTFQGRSLRCLSLSVLEELHLA